MIIEYIENLRKQPPEVRRTVARFWTAAAVLMIIGFYIVVRIILALVVPGTSEPPSTIQAPYASENQ